MIRAIKHLLLVVTFAALTPLAARADNARDWNNPLRICLLTST